MKQLFTLIATAIIALCAHTAIAADSHKAYFKALNATRIIPKGATAILPASKKTIEAALSLLKKNHINTGYNYRDDILLGKYGEDMVMYVGHFSNQIASEYLFLSIHGGSANVSGVDRVYQIKKQTLTPLNYNKILIKSLVPGRDLSAFYLSVAAPFAYTLHNKTYLRYIQYPPKNEFNPKKLLVCTYLWHNNTITAISGKPCITGQ